MRKLVHSFLFNRPNCRVNICIQDLLIPNKPVSLVSYHMGMMRCSLLIIIFFFTCQNVDRLSQFILIQTILRKKSSVTGFLFLFSNQNTLITILHCDKNRETKVQMLHFTNIHRNRSKTVCF